MVIWTTAFQGKALCQCSLTPKFPLADFVGNFAKQILSQLHHVTDVWPFFAAFLCWFLLTVAHT